MLTRDQGVLLVKKTRQGIEAHLRGSRNYDFGQKDSSELWKKRGVFVTIKEEDTQMLRGCIGNPYPEKPLVTGAVEAGILAATADPRFRPVTFDELHTQLCLELTILSPLEQLRENDPRQIPASIVIGTDGLLVDGFGMRGLLLPQVAVEEEFDGESFLTNCCLKAGLPPDTWLSREIKIYRFGGQVFSENSPNRDAVEVNLQQTNRK